MFNSTDRNICRFTGLGRRVRRQTACRLTVRGRRQSRTLGGLDSSARGRGRRRGRRGVLAGRGREARVPPALVRRLVRRARHHPCRERQVLPGAGRRRGARLLRRSRRRPMRLEALLPRKAAQDDELMCVKTGAISPNCGPFFEAISASVQYVTRHRTRNGAGERRGGALRAGVRGRRRGALRPAERARPGRRARHPLPRAAPARPGLRLRRRGAAHHRLGLGAEPLVAVGAGPPRGRVARRLGLERGQLRAAAGADELVHGARAAAARAVLSACDRVARGRGRGR